MSFIFVGRFFFIHFRAREDVGIFYRSHGRAIIFEDVEVLPSTEDEELEYLTLLLHQ